MRKAYCILFVVLICYLRAAAQDLIGKVTDNDSASTVLYQAEVTQSQNGKVIATYKTFFDGTFRMKVKPSQSYQVKASYPGRRDSTVTISVDKNGTLYAGTLFLSLSKNGLRLMGYVLDREEDIPIKDAGITIRNVMTRKEDKYFTDVNGYYNLKMDFETNYTFRIDKRSPGIMNKYQDTSFNISTIGFTQALDFRLDIKLGPVAGYIKPRPEYDPYAKPDNKNLKPVLQVVGKKDTSKLSEQTALAKELGEKINVKDPSVAAIDKKQNDTAAAKHEQKVSNTEPVKKAVVKDTVAIASVDKKKAESVTVKKEEKAAVDTVSEEQKRKEQEQAKAEMVAKIKADEAHQAMLIAEQMAMDRDSIARVKAEELKKQKEAADLKRKEEEAQQAKQNAELAPLTKAEQARINKENAAISKADSMLIADELKQIQKDKDLVAMKYAREKAEAKPINARRDSIAREKMARKESKRLAQELAEQAKQRKKAEEEAKRIVEEKQRLIAKRTQSEKEQKELDAKKTQEEQEKKNLIQQHEKVLTNQQVRVAKDKEPDYGSGKSVEELNQKKAIEDWEKKRNDEKPKKVDSSSIGKIEVNAMKPVAVKIVKTRGIVKNGQTEDAITNVSINIRRLNSIVSQEVTSDEKGNYQFLVDSGYFYLVSFYKDRYEINKQVLDLTTYTKPEYNMLIQYLKEKDDFDPNAKMPIIQFEKNSSKLPEGLYGDLESIVKMMKEIPALKMKVYGLGSLDEDYPMELSITRARLVADLMLENGIAPGRIRINGIGAFRPRSGCVKGKECTQDQYKLDRVVMYKVIKE